VFLGFRSPNRRESPSEGFSLFAIRVNVPDSVEEILTNAAIITLAAFAATSDLDEEEEIVKSLRSRLRDSKRITALKRGPPN
jgi:hypothetical protein